MKFRLLQRRSKPRLRLSLATKMFVALFGTSAVMIVLVVAWTGWALDEGFSLYVSTVALASMDGPAQVLEQTFADHGSWSNVTEASAAWSAVLRQAGPPGPAPGGVPGHPPGPGGPPPFGIPGAPPSFTGKPPVGRPWGGEGPPREPPLGAEMHDLAKHLALVDALGRLVAGPRPRLVHPARRTLIVNGVKVGELLYDAGPLPSGIESAFVRNRLHELYLAGAVAMILSAIAATLLARHILVPINLVTEEARRLASGDFAARITGTRRDELGRLVTDFNALAKALENAELSRRQWVADTSHELRTPLAVLIAQIEALQDGVQPVGERALSNLHGEAVRMTRLVDDLHELSRADSGALSLHLETVEPGAIMAEVISGFAARGNARQLRIEAVGLDVSAGLVQVDASRMRQVFSNIVENAIRYTDPGGLVSVSLSRKGGDIAITVQDSAPGVAAAKLPRLFDRFFRIESSRSRSTGGSGLGLAICKAIVEAHAGRITAAQSPLGGLKIAVTLPAAKKAT